MFAPYYDKTQLERDAISRRELDRNASISEAAKFVRSNQPVRTQAVELSARSTKISNENWTSELTREWREWRAYTVDQYRQEYCPNEFLEGERTQDELSEYFEYGLQFIVRELKNGEFDFTE